MTSPTVPLHPRFAEIVDYLDRARDELLAYVNSLPESALQARTDAERWSVTDTLEHLVLVEDGAGRCVSHIAKQVREQGVAPETETISVLGCLDEWDAVNGEQKLAAPERVRPSGTKTAQESLENLKTSRARLLQAVQGANGLDLTQATMPHPFFGLLNGYQWLVLIAQHELRHLRQMKNTMREIELAPATTTGPRS